MSSAFETAIQAGLAAARQVAGSSITYGRGETTLTVTDAVQGETRKGVIDVGGSEQIVEMCDWMIEVSALSGLSDTPDRHNIHLDGGAPGVGAIALGLVRHITNSVPDSHTQRRRHGL